MGLSAVRTLLGVMKPVLTMKCFRICHNGLVAVGQTTAASANRGRPRSSRGRGKSELRRTVRRVTPGQGDLTDSGTENIPPRAAEVRVKWCGKSAPRLWQHGWQAKPRTEQDQIGWRLRAVRPKSPGRLPDPASDCRARGMVVPAWHPRGRYGGQNSAYRPTVTFVVASRVSVLRRARCGSDEGGGD